MSRCFRKGLHVIGYVTIGTNDFDRATDFYDQLLAVVGISRLWQHESMAAWGRSRDEIALCITTPHNGNEATVGNGVMVALRMENRDQVDAVHAKCVELGGADDGKPGPRGDHGFYGGYFRDLDGNKLNAYLPG